MPLPIDTTSIKDRFGNHIFEMGKLLQAFMPEYHGSVVFRFNLQPPRKDVYVNVNTEESVILKENDYALRKT